MSRLVLVSGAHHTELELAGRLPHSFGKDPPLKQAIAVLKKRNIPNRAPPTPPHPTDGESGIDGDHLLMRETTRVGDEEVARVVREADNIRQTVRDAGPLRGFLDDCSAFLLMVRDYATGSYRMVPFGCIAAVAAAMLYVLNPFDLVPDAIPGIGFIDDATVVGACLRLVGNDLKKYREWRATQPAG